MTEIQVTFPPSGQPTVTHDPEAAVAGGLVTWHIRSNNPGLGKVRIWMQDVKAKFFMDDNGNPTHERILNFVSVAGGDRRAVVWGKAPEVFEGTRQDDKYTVVGLDPDGLEVKETELDPTIITIKP